MRRLTKEMTPEDADQIIEAHTKHDTAKVLELLNKDVRATFANLINNDSKRNTNNNPNDNNNRTRFVETTNESREKLEALGLIEPRSRNRFADRPVKKMYHRYNSQEAYF